MSTAVPRIGRTPNLFLRDAVPVVVTMAGSLTVMLPIVATAPIMPPFGLLMLLSWRLLHRNLWPAWVPLLLGLFDDLVSGQPLGSAMLLWPACFLALDLIDPRMMWRDFELEWGLAGAMIAAVMLASLAIANLTGGATSLLVIVPQILFTILLFPLCVLFCARFNRWRFKL